MPLLATIFHFFFTILNLYRARALSDPNSRIHPALAGTPVYHLEFIFFDQAELNDLIRDLNLSKDKVELLGSRLKEKNLLNKKVIISYRNRQKYLAFLKIFQKRTI